MAKFSDYVDQGYLPGEIYSSGLESLDPYSKTAYLSEKTFDKFKFKPDSSGSFFQKFLNLQSNPTGEMMKDMYMPERIKQYITMFGGQ